MQTNLCKPYAGPPNPDPYDEQERAAILEFDAGMERAEAEQAAAVMTRPQTHAEAVEWIEKNKHDPEYCRTCLTARKASLGVSAARQVFEQAPESVRKWINENVSRWQSKGGLEDLEKASHLLSLLIESERAKQDE